MPSDHQVIPYQIRQGCWEGGSNTPIKISIAAVKVEPFMFKASVTATDVY